MFKHELICQRCDTTFMSRHKEQRFCCRACGSKARIGIIMIHDVAPTIDEAKEQDHAFAAAMIAAGYLQRKPSQLSSTDCPRSLSDQYCPQVRQTGAIWEV